MKKINSIEIFFNNVINSVDFSLGYAIVNSYILSSTRIPFNAFNNKNFIGLKNNKR